MLQGGSNLLKIMRIAERSSQIRWSGLVGGIALLTLAVVCIVGAGCGSLDEPVRRSLKGKPSRSAGQYPPFGTTNDINEAAAHLSSDIAAFKSVKGPWTLSDVGLVQPANDDDNAASFLSTAIQKVDRLFPPDAKPSESVSDDWVRIRRVRRIAASQEWNSISELLVLASAKKALDFHLNWLTTNSKLAPELSDMGLFIRLLCFKANAEATLGHGVKSAEYLTNAWNLAELLGSAPPLEARMAALSSFDDISHEIERCVTLLVPGPKTFSNPVRVPSVVMVNRQPPTPPAPPSPRGQPLELIRFRNSLLLSKSFPSFAQGVRFVIYSQIACTRIADGYDFNDGSPRQLIDESQLPRSPTGKARTARELEFWSANLPTVQNLDRDPATGGKALEDSFARVRGQRNDSYYDVKRKDSSFEQIGATFARSTQLRDAEFLLLGAVINWCSTGQWPPQTEPGLPSSRNPPGNAGLQIMGMGESCTVMMSGTSSTRFVAVRSNGSGMSQIAMNPSVGASYPSGQCQEDINLANDQQIIDRLPTNDIQQATSRLGETLAASHKARIPYPPGNETIPNVLFSYQSYQDFDRSESLTGDLEGAHATSTADLDPKIPLSILGSTEPNESSRKGSDLLPVWIQYDSPMVAARKLCCAQVVDIYCAKARLAARRNQGFDAGHYASEAWNAVAMSKTDPGSYPIGFLTGCLESVDQVVEDCAGALYSNYPEFKKFDLALQIDSNPISARWSFESQLLSETYAESILRPIAPSDGSTTVTGMRFEDAKVERLLEFWLSNKAQISNLDQQGSLAIRELTQEQPKIQEHTGQSYDGLKSFINQTSGGMGTRLEAPYMLRDAERLLIASLIFRHDHGAWPTSIADLKLLRKSPEDRIWNFQGDDESLQIHGSINNENMPSNIRQPRQTMRSMLTLDQIVAAYPPLQPQRIAFVNTGTVISSVPIVTTAKPKLMNP